MNRGEGIARALLCAVLAALLAPVSAHAVVAVSKEFLAPASVTPANLQSTAGQVADNTPAQGDVRTVRIAISQVGAAISAGSLTDPLPPQIRLADPVNLRFSADCGPSAALTTGVPGGGVLATSQLAVPAGTNALPGRCFVYFDVVSTQVGNWINQIPAGGFNGVEAGVGPVSNADPAPRNLTVTGLSALGVVKSFSASPVFMGALTTLTIQVSNPNAGRSVALTQLTESLPANLAAEDTTPVVACSAGSTAGTASASGTTGSVTITFSGTVVAGGGSCTLTWLMRGVVQNGTNVSGTNTIPANSVVNSRGLNSAAASAAITVQAPITHSKSFSPDPARAGEPITLTIDVVNRSAAAVSAVGWSDTLPGDLVVTGAAASANAACAGATVGGAVGATVISLSGATVAAGATCRVTVTVVGNTVQTYNNSTGGASWTQGGNSAVSSAATASVAIFSGFRAFKTILDRNGQPFNGAVAPGDPLRFRIELENFADGQISGVTVIDPLPAAGGAQLVYATAATPGASNPRTNCTSNADAQQAGAIAAPSTAQTDGAATVTFSGLVVPGNPNGNAAAATRCFLEFDAVVPRNWPAGTQISNSIPAANISGPGGLQAQNTIVANVPTITQFQLFKSFSPATLSAGETSVVTLTLVNNGFFALTGVELDDPLPAPVVNGIAAQLRVADPSSFATSCGGTPVVTVAPARERLQVSGLTVPARISGLVDNRCTVSFRVRAPLPTGYPNVASAPAVTDARTGSAIPSPAPAGATLTATPSLTAAKAFAPSPVNASGGVSTVTITLGNIGTGLLTGVGVSDPLPAALRVASPANASTTCGGPTTITATPGASTAQLTGARVPAGTSCTFKFDVVTSGAANPVTNSIPPGGVFADGGVITTTATSASLGTFAGGGINLQKGFAPTDLQAPGQPTRLTLTLANVSTQALTGLGVTDDLPAGMVVTATPNAVTTCGGGVVEAAAGGTRVRLVGGSLPAGNGAFPAPAAATCTVAVDVTLRRTGTVSNSIAAGAVASDQALTNSDVAVANVTALATVGVSKRFEPLAVTPGTPSRLVLTVLNSAGIDFNSLQVVDPLPAGLQVAVPAGASTTCGSGTVSTRPSLLGGGRTDVVMSGGTLAGAATDTTSCEIAIDVVASTQAAYLNTVPVGNVTADGGVSNSAPASATLNVRAAAGVSKAFAQFNRRINEENRLTLTITNPSAVPLTNVSLTDTYPAHVFNGTTPDVATTCVSGVVTAAPSGSFVRLTGATVPANGSCTFSVDVLANVVGSWTNSVPDGALSSAEGITNPAPANASFVTLDPPTLGKEFRPVQIGAGGTSRLRIVLLNTNSIALTLTGALNDVLPAGLSLGSPALDTTTTDPQGRPRCVSVSTSGATITMASGAAIPAGGCVIWANVTGSAPGQYLNAIPAGGLATSAGPNALPATATLSISTQGAISGTVYRDSDNNGVIGGGDLGIAGETVELLDAGGAVIATVVTDALGNYAFVDLPPGSYSVRQPQQPAGTLNGTTSPPSGATSAGTATTPTAAPSQISGIVLGAGQVAQGANFGEVAPASIAGRVFLDRNNDGVAQSADVPLSGVTVTLTGTNDLGQPVSLSTTTDANGDYRFDNLRPGTYTLTEPTQPAGTANGITRSGSGTSNAGTPSALTTQPSAISGIVLAPGQRGTGFDFAEVALASVSGTVYVDRDRNNAFNPSDTGRIPGVTLRLVQGADCASGTTLATTATDAAGNYRFDNVAAGGSYLVCQTQPAGYSNGNAGGAAGSNVIAITNLPASGLGGNNFGELGASLAGGVYLDADNDSVRDAGEAGIGGVQVALSGTDVAGNAVTRSTVTDSAGNYRFDDLPQGSYTLTQQAAQPVVGGVTTLNGRTTAGAIGGASVGSASAVTATPSAIGAIALPAGTAGNDYNFGEILPVSVSGSVFFDNNANGAQNAGETGIPGQTIAITGVDDLGQSVSRNLVTDGSGNFSVTDLRPGTYTLTQPVQPPGSANGVTSAGPAGGTATPSTTLPSAVSGIVLTTPGAAAPANVFAELPLGSSIAGRVWRDADDDGVIDAGETLLAGVTIELTGTDVAGNAVTRSVVTDANGNYAFTGLPPGTYQVRQPTQPTGTVNGRTIAGSAAGTPSVVATVPSTIGGIVLGANVAAVNYDFGELPAGTIGGAVYSDTNDNGQRDVGEAGFGGQTIALTGTDDLGASVNLTTQTAPDGSFSFSGLRPGTYTLTQPAQPADSVPGRNSAGTLGGSASPVAPGPSVIANIVLPIGGSSSGNLFGEIGNSPNLVATKATVEVFATDNRASYRITVANIGQVASSGAYTLEDRLPSGLQLAGAPTGSGWSCTGTGGEVRFACTSSEAIGAGAVSSSTISVPVFIAANATGGAAAVVLDNALIIEGGGELPAYRPTPAERTLFETNAAALPVCTTPASQNLCRTPTTVLRAAGVGGTVWYDIGNSTRQLDGSDQRLAGWIVEVVDADTLFGAVVRRVITGADGSWRADGLVPGRAYLIRFRDPQSNVVFGVPVSGEQGVPPVPCLATNPGNANRSSCVQADTGTQLRIILEAGDNLVQQSLPLIPFGVVYDAVTRNPVPGATVTLTPLGSCPGWNPADHIAGAQLGGYTIAGSAISMTVGSLGAYTFAFTAQAPASCQFAVRVTPPATHSFPSQIIPAQPGLLAPPPAPGTAFVQPQPAPPTGSQPTPWFGSIGGGATLQPIVNNHIPLDPRNVTGIVIIKTGSVREVELGDSLQYAIRVRNTSTFSRGALYIDDRLPAGFRYIPGTARVERSGASVAIADPTGGVGPNLTFAIGALAANSELTLTYRVRVAVGSQQGDGINRARAKPLPSTNCQAQPAECSNESRWQVRINAGVFTTDACVLGKVFVDCNGNSVQDGEELGIPGVRLYLQNGRFAITDSEGKYSMCGLPPRTHVIKPDTLTLPRGARLTTSSSRNAGDANSLFVDLKNGELHRADFIEGSCSNPLLEQVKARRTQGEVGSQQTERRGGAPLRFQGKAPGAPQQATDSANQQPAVRPRPGAPPGESPSRDENDVPLWQLPMNRQPTGPGSAPATGSGATR